MNKNGEFRQVVQPMQMMILAGVMVMFASCMPMPTDTNATDGDKPNDNTDVVDDSLD